MRATFLALILAGATASAQTFQKSYSIGAGGETGGQCRQTRDAGYVLLGTTQVGSQILVTKLDSNGAVAWAKTYGGSDVDVGNSIQQTRDGGYVVAGYTLSFGAGLHDAYVLRLDAAGNVRWSRTYGGAGDDFANSIRQTRDGGYIVTGFTSSAGAGDRDVWLLKLTGTGAVQWSKTFGGFNTDEANDVRSTFDDGYVLVGKTHTFGAGGADVYLIKTDAAGNLQWSRTFGTIFDIPPGYDDIAYSVAVAPNSFFVAGVASHFDSQTATFDQRAYFLRVDTNGTPLVSKSYNGGSNREVATSIEPTRDGGFVLAGSAYSFAVTTQEVFVLKLRPNGNLETARTFASGDFAQGASAQRTGDGGYAIAGYRHAAGSPFSGYALFLVKTDSALESCAGNSVIPEEELPPTAYTIPATEVGDGPGQSNPAPATNVADAQLGVTTQCE